VSLTRQDIMEIKVDGKLIPLNDYVKNFVRNIILGILDSLKGIPETRQQISLKINGEGGCTLSVQEKKIPINRFVRNIVANVVQAIVSSLKDVPKNPKKVEIYLNDFRE